MKTLKESILDDMDDTLSIKNPYEVLYPLPTTKDFVKNIYSKHHSVKWQCSELIKPYLNEIASITNGNYGYGDIYKATGIECNIDRYKCIYVYLINKDGFRLTNLNCIGDWVSNSLPTTKKECLNFFKTILDNPENCFRKIIDYIKKANQSKAQYGFADHITFEKLFK